MCKLDHVALCVKEYDWYISFFENVFEMKIKKESGAEPERKVWFDKGMPLIESKEKPIPGTLYDHIAFKADDKEVIYTRLKAQGCKEYLQKENWFIVRDALVVEIL